MSHEPPTRPDTDVRVDRRARLPRVSALVVGAVFLLVGVAGFVPGITTGVGDITLAGHESGAELLGVFQVSVLHNAVHLVFGVVGLAVSARAVPSVLYLLVGGAIYLVLWLYGVVVGHDSPANVVPLNDADNWLHLGLGLGMLGLGAFTGQGVVLGNRPGVSRPGRRSATEGP